MWFSLSLFRNGKEYIESPVIPIVPPLFSFLLNQTIISTNTTFVFCRICVTFACSFRLHTMLFYIKRVLFCTIVLFLLIPLQAQYLLRGSVCDSLTQEPLSYVSVYLKGTTTGTTTDDEGKFSFQVSQREAELVVSTIGYEEYVEKIDLSLRKEYQIRLAPATYGLSEVVVRPGRERYSRKENPAVAFVRQVIEHKEKGSPYAEEYYTHDRYDKTTFALNNFDEYKQNKRLYRKFDFLREYVDTSEVTGKPVLTVSIREALGTDYYRKSPRSEKQYIHAVRRDGIDEIIPRQGMEAMMNEVFRDVDIYENNITLFTNKFVSPLSKMGPSFYKYYLSDTLDIDGKPHVDLTFVPFNSESFGFTGHLFVTLDSTYFVRRVQMNFPQKINLNFVDDMTLQQEFTRTPGGVRLLQHEEITTVFKLREKSDGIFARRLVTYYNHSFDKPQWEEVFSRPERVIEDPEALYRENVFWQAERPRSIDEKEDAVDRLMDQLRNHPAYYWTEKGISVLFNGYLNIPEDKPRFYYGPLNSTVSGNALEGIRLRAGGMTSAHLNPHWLAKGFVAYGIRDAKWKYMGELEYSFLPKKEYANEFPIHSVKAVYEYDVRQYGQNYLLANKDNMFLSVKRKTDDRIGYSRKAELTYTHERYSGFSYYLTTRYRTEEASHFIPFEVKRENGRVDFLRDFSLSELELKLRYSPNEKFMQTQWSRYKVSYDAPVFTLAHTASAKGFLGSNYTLHHTEAGFEKRFWFSAFGYTDAILRGGKVWSKVPFPLLIIPRVNLTYITQPESYVLMNAMEFLNDEYVSWDLTYYLNGLLFNRIPLLKKLEWREILSFRGMYGGLSDKNNPEHSEGLFLFPEGSHTLGSRPYMEAGFGIENVFKVFRFDYTWRLTYRDLEGIDRSGLRITARLNF